MSLYGEHASELDREHGGALAGVAQLRREYANELGRRVAAGAESLITGGLPKDFDVARLRVDLYPDGVKVYHYCGEPFLELHPPKIEQDERPYGVTSVKAVQFYRYLNGGEYCAKSTS